MVRYDGEVVENGAPRRKYTQVFSLRITPPAAPHQIDIAKIYDFIYYLFADLRVNIIAVSYDQYQSTGSQQALRKGGLMQNTDLLTRTIPHIYFGWDF